MWPWLTRRMHCSPQKTQKTQAIQTPPPPVASVSAGWLCSRSGGTRCNFVLSISTCIMWRQPAQTFSCPDEVTPLLCFILEGCSSDSIKQVSIFWCLYDSLTCHKEGWRYKGERVMYGKQFQRREWQAGLDVMCWQTLLRSQRIRGLITATAWVSFS